MENPTMLDQPYFDRYDVQRHLDNIVEHTERHLTPRCQAKLEYDYIIAHQNDPAFIDKLMAALDDFDPATYWPHNTPGYVGVRPYRPAMAGDIDTALHFHLEDVAQEVATDILLAEGVRTPLAALREKSTKTH